MHLAIAMELSFLGFTASLPTKFARNWISYHFLSITFSLKTFCYAIIFYIQNIAGRFEKVGWSIQRNNIFQATFMRSVYLVELTVFQCDWDVYCTHTVIKYSILNIIHTALYQLQIHMEEYVNEKQVFRIKLTAKEGEGNSYIALSPWYAPLNLTQLPKRMVALSCGPKGRQRNLVPCFCKWK